MPKLPIVSGDEVIRALERAGFTRTRQKGSHVTMTLRTADGVVFNVTVPLHAEVARGTLRAIIRDAGLTVDRFDSLR